MVPPLNHQKLKTFCRASQISQPSTPLPESRWFLSDTVVDLDYSKPMPVKAKVKDPKGVIGYAICDLLRATRSRAGLGSMWVMFVFFGLLLLLC